MPPPSAIEEMPDFSRTNRHLAPPVVRSARKIASSLKVNELPDLHGPHRFRMPGIVGVESGLKFAALLAESRQVQQPDPLQSELQRCRQHTESVRDAAPEVDRRRLFKILRRTRHFPDAEAKMNALRQ